MKNVKVTYFPVDENEGVKEILFEDVISCYEAFENEGKQFILQLPNSVSSDKLEALASGKINTISIIDISENPEEDIVLSEYTNIKQLHKSYYSVNSNTFRTSIYFEKKY